MIGITLRFALAGVIGYCIGFTFVHGPGVAVPVALAALYARIMVADYMRREDPR